MIIPTILEKNWEEIEKHFEIYKDFAKSVHVDFIDGKFKDNKTFFEFEPFRKYSEYFSLEAHLMVDEPAQYLDELSKAGFKTILGHVEKMSDQVDFIARGELLGAVGLALDIETPVSEIKVSINDLDRILLMGIYAGASGRPFDERVLSKIKEVSDKSFSNIQIDGGVDEATLPLLREKGANMFCVNSFLFEGDPKSQFRKLEELL